MKRSGTVDPSKYPDEFFDLYSIPAYDRSNPDVVAGREIGSSKQVVRPGDVLLSRIVPHIRRAWIVGSDDGRRLIASGEWMVFRSENCDPRWLRQLLLSDRFHREFMATVAGVGGSLLRARPAHVAEITIRLPPLDEQRRIAAILGQADGLQEIERRAILRMDELQRSIFHQMFGDPLTNDMGWDISTIGDSCVRVTDGEHKTPRRSEAGVPLLSARSVQNGWIDFEATDFVPEEEYELLRKRIDPTEGDILISCSGSIGRVARVGADSRFAMVRSVALVRPGSCLSPGFLQHLLSTGGLNQLMVSRANSSAQANLFQNQIKALPVILPPIGLQKEFEGRIAETSNMRMMMSSLRNRCEELFHSLQSHAFVGEL